MIGRVVSTKMNKTVTVLVESRKTHRMYKKTYAWSKKYLAHDEKDSQMGDIVQIIKCRPISKRKHWMVTKVLGKDIVPMSEEALKAEAANVIAEVMPEEKEEKLSSMNKEVTVGEVEEKKEKKVEKETTKAKKVEKEVANSKPTKKDTKTKKEEKKS